MEHRTCSKCGKSFPATLEYFYNDRVNNRPLRSWCKICFRGLCNKNAKRYYQDHKTDPHFRKIRKSCIERYRARHPDRYMALQSFSNKRYLKRMKQNGFTRRKNVWGKIVDGVWTPKDKLND